MCFVVAIKYKDHSMTSLVLSLVIDLVVFFNYRDCMVHMDYLYLDMNSYTYERTRLYNINAQIAKE